VSSSTHTISPAKKLAELGFRPQKGLGQHFLVEPGVVKNILDRAELDPALPVLEIGPGLGALTIPLLERGFMVTAVEIDRGLAGWLEAEAAPAWPGRLKVIQADVLEMDLAAEASLSGGRISVLGNLPYQISTPLLFRLRETRSSIAQAVLMFQREVADRLTARPGTKDYGRLGVVFSLLARVERLLEVGPTVFFPRPKVGSTVVRIVFRESPEPALLSEPVFFEVVKAAFSRRRKTLKNALASAFPPAEVEAALSAARVAPGRRAETLTAAEFAALADAFFLKKE
jgi:16S rRNA (adenine1518-N6/adenine1519-N6)-dimethyltransferase